MTETPRPKEDPQISDPFDLLLADARTGDNEAVGKILEQCRDYLLLIANQGLDKNMQRKMGASDLVQESMLTAQANFDLFDGENREHFLAWLRGILLNDVKHWRRHWKGTKKREVRRETEISGSKQMFLNPPDPLRTPGTQAAADEEETILFRAMDALPENYRQVIQLRNWDEKSFAEIGERLDCSADAARKLWSRAILKLQEYLATEWPELDSTHLRQEED